MKKMMIVLLACSTALFFGCGQGGEQSAGDGDGAPPARGAPGPPGDDPPLSPHGRALALEARDDADAPALVVVAPERAALQTALLAFRRRDGTGPRFVAHDAARVSAAPSATARELRLEYGDVDFSACDDDPSAATAPGDRAFALLCFVKARPETDVAVVADAPVLSSLVACSRGSPPRLRLAPNRAQNFRVTFDAAEDDDEPESW